MRVALLTALLLSPVSFATSAAQRANGYASAYSPADSNGHFACTGRQITWKSYGLANWTAPCGSRWRICFARKCFVAPVIDRGPAPWTGRRWDLTPGLYVKWTHTLSPFSWGVRYVTATRVR